VELTTLSFKAPTAFVEHVKRYARQCRRPVSELVRDGLEWRIGDGDPRDMRDATVTDEETPGTGNTDNTAVAVFQDLLSPLVTEVRQLARAVQALEQRVQDTPAAREVSGNTDIPARREEVPGAAPEQDIPLVSRPHTGPKRGGRPPVWRGKIIDLLHAHPGGLSATAIKGRLDIPTPIGDTIGGMVRAGLLVKVGTGRAVRYRLAMGTPEKAVVQEE
jgi:hypothetical protein